MNNLEKQVADFFGKLGNMFEAGLPVCRSLRTLAEEIGDGPMREVITDLLQRIEKGATVSEALGHYPALFPPSLVAMVEAGEVTGTLEKVVLNIHRGIADGSLTIRDAAESAFQAAGAAAPESGPRTESDEDPAVRLISSLISDAVKARASDVHLEFKIPERVRVRYRIDGVLREVEPLPGKFLSALAARIKIMGAMNASEKRLPQDGRIQVTVAGRTFDIRVSVAPCAEGESIVLRLLDLACVPTSIAALELSPAQLGLLQSWYRKPSGLILVTGPIGSGKTTTLYALLQELNKPTVKVMTVEDPVEVMIKGVCQMPVRPSIGLTFAALLRSQLRQDPDVFMVGEIRDVETAQVAVQAVLCGKLVLTSLHTPDAPSALQRLCDIGLEPFLVSSTVTGIVAQRLVRRICPDCREACTPPDWVRESLRIRGDAPSFRGKGCEKCGQTGYRGRVPIYELLPVTDPIRLALAREQGLEPIRQAAAEAGVPTLREDGLAKVAAGVTTLEEVMRQCG
jgi:type II secretory ATPase GspE/PulE/Tfp pilus assembly ATPase PilB-like protein